MDEVFTVLRVVVSLAVVVGVIWFVQKKYVRSSRTKSRKRPVSLVARQSVGGKSSVAVIEFQGKQFLLGVTEHSISVLDSFAAAEPVIAEPTVTAVKPVSRRASSKEFAAVLTGVQTDVPAASVASVARVAGKRTSVPDALAASLSRQKSGTGVSGSILSGATWKQAFAAIKGNR